MRMEGKTTSYVFLVPMSHANNNSLPRKQRSVLVYSSLSLFSHTQSQPHCNLSKMLVSDVLHPIFIGLNPAPQDSPEVCVLIIPTSFLCFHSPRALTVSCCYYHWYTSMSSLCLFGSLISN